MKRYITSISLALCGVLSSIKNVFAGDKLIDFNLVSAEISNKPNTGDTNTLIIYGSVALIALLVLIFINVKGLKKNKDNNEQQVNNQTEEDKDN